jgi:hypothetical protein
MNPTQTFHVETVEALASDINRRAESGSSPWTPRGRRGTQQIRKT